jgi:ATP-dependent Clp protease protease subunit
VLKYTTVDPKIKIKNYADLIEPPVIIRINKFNEETVEKFAESMAKAHETGQPVIPIVVDSYGGSVYSLLSFYNEIQNSKLPVATICESKAMSAGAMLFGFGNEGYRFIAPNATLMIHEVSSFQYGKVEDLKADADESDRLNTLIFKLLAKNCKQKENHFLDIIHERGHADWFLTAKDAKKHNLANHLKIPEMKITVSVETQFG